MRSMGRLRDAIGTIGIAAVLLTPLITALVAWFLAPRFVVADQRASAQVSLYEVVGTHAAYDLASYVADFQQGLTSPEAARAAQVAAGGPDVQTALASTRLGDSTNVFVTFAAPTASAAEAGLRAATLVALTSLVDDDRDRAEVELRAALAQLRTPDLGVPPLGVAPEVRERSIEIIAERGAVALSDAQRRVVLARTVLNSVDDITAKQTVTLETLSTTEDQFRIIAAAAASSLVPILLVVAVLHAGRRQRPEEVSGPPASARTYEASLL